MLPPSFAFLRGCHDYYHEFSNLCHIRVIRGYKRHKGIKIISRYFAVMLPPSFAFLRGLKKPSRFFAVNWFFGGYASSGSLTTWNSSFSSL